jgi:hypothetical protein
MCCGCGRRIDLLTIAVTSAKIKAFCVLLVLLLMLALTHALFIAIKHTHPDWYLDLIVLADGQ